jgi:hypothetical protein
MQQAQIFIFSFELQIQNLPNFFERYQHFSMGSEISGFQLNFGKIDREKNPCLEPSRDFLMRFNSLASRHRQKPVFRCGVV